MTTAQDKAKLIKLRWLFGFVFLGLMAQFLFTWLVQEPYPAIVYPPFRALAIKHGQLKLNKREIVIESQTQPPMIVEEERFFQSLPESFVPNALATIKQRMGQSEKRIEVHIGRHHLFTLRYLLPQNAQMDRVFKRWLKTEIARNFQIVEPTQLIINDYGYQFALPRGVLQAKQPLGTLTIDLTDRE